MPQLQELIGPAPGRRHVVSAETAVLGRHPDCDVVLESAAVSRQHAQIVRQDGEFYVEDLGSRNGTFVNGQLVHGRQRLADGDRLRVCDLTFRFCLDQREQSTVTTPGFAGDESDRSSFMVEDESDERLSTITSRLDVSSGHSGIHLAVKPEAKLKALVEITQSLSRTLVLEEVLPRLLDSLFKIFIQADRGFIALRTSADGVLVPKAIKHRRPDATDTVRISKTIVNQVVMAKKAILSADAATDERFDMSQSIVEFRIRSMMCAPIINSDGDVLGIIQIDTLDQRSRFQEDDLEVLASVASQAAISVDNANLHAAAMRQQQVLRDLEMARKVQQSMLPTSPPVIEGYRFFDYYQSAREVGGDYYDYISLPDGRLAVVVADVSGKGMSAALLMARLSSDVRYCLASEKTPAAAVNRLNSGLARGGWEDRFVTLVLGVLDPRAHVVTIVNAGHMAPLLRYGEPPSADQPVADVAEAQAGLPLGVIDEYEYEQYSLPLAPGDFLTLFTDGISEAMNGDGEFYGTERIRQQIGAPIDNVAQLGRHILDDVKSFVGGRAQSDDICLACFGRDQVAKRSSRRTVLPQSTVVG